MITNTKSSSKDISKYFAVVSRSSDLNKQKLIALAKSGAKKPDRKTKLGSAFDTYTRNSSVIYDLNFVKDIKKYAPNWLERSHNIKKQQLIQMAKKGKSKPKRTSLLGNALRNYFAKPLHNRDFIKTIKKHAPDWLCSPYDIKKQQLIQMAKKGKSKPKSKTPLGGSLYAFTKNKTYNRDFIKTIKKHAPDWLRKYRKNDHNNKI
jgi:hypothetical protein